MSDKPFRAIVYAEDGNQEESDNGPYWSDLFEMIEADSIEELMIEASKIRIDGDAAPSIWRMDRELTEQLAPGHAEAVARRKAEREAEARRREVARNKDRAASARRQIATLESGKEIERLRRELDEAESAIRAAGAEA